ncbi:hypothetical protein SAMN05428975_5916 [Mucilaginibacter sp. OK268]|nr:hypothetical protein SAMN05428975_5916 [Mucilaginibacter sp. OK268]
MLAKTIKKYNNRIVKYDRMENYPPIIALQLKTGGNINFYSLYLKNEFIDYHLYG